MPGYRRFFKLPLLGLFGAAFLLSPFSAFSQQIQQDKQDTNHSDDSGSVSLEAVQVKAKHPFPQAEADQAAASSVITHEQMSQPGKGVADLLDQEVGLNVTRQGGLDAFSTLSIRGSSAEQVLIFLDGIPLNSAEGGPVNLSLLPLGNLEKIEIYRGAAPILLGGSAIGGVVNLVSNSTSKRTLELTGGGGSYGTRSAQGSFSDQFGLFQLTLGLDYSGSMGNFDYIDDRGTRADASDDREITRTHNHFDRINSLIKAKISLGDGLTLALLDHFFWQDQDLAGTALFPVQKSELQQYKNLSALQFTVTRIGRFKLNWRTMAHFRFSQTRFSDPLSEIGVGVQDTSDNSYAAGAGTYAKLPVLPWLTPSVTLEYRYEWFQPKDRVVKTDKPSSARHAVNAGMEADFFVEAIDTNIVPSGRLEYIQSSKDMPQAIGGEAGGEIESDSLEASYRLALVNRSIPYTMLKLHGGRNIRFPSLFELFGDTGSVRPNPNLRTEKSWNIDLGLVHDATWMPEPHRWQIEMYGFCRWVEDLIQFVESAQNVFIAQNLDKARLAGFEIGTSLDLGRLFLLRANYSYLDTHVDSSIRSHKNKVLPLNPKSKWFGHAEFYWSAGRAVPKTGIFVEAEWAAGNFLDSSNLTAVPSRFYLSFGQYLTLYGDYVTIRLSARNMTNERTADLTGYPLPGRAFFGSLTVKGW